MKTFEYTPPEDSLFTGTATVEMLHYKQRMQYGKEFGDSKDASNLFDVCKRHIQSMDFECKGEKYSDIEDLAYSKQGSDIITSIGLELIQGHDLGN